MKYAILCIAIILMASSTRANLVDENLDKVKNVWTLLSNNLGFESPPLTADPDLIDEIDKYVTLFLKYSKISSLVNDTAECNNATVNLAYSLRDSINNLKSKGFNKDSYLQLTSALGVAQPMIKVCFNSSYDGYKKAAAHIGEFKDVNTFFEKFGLNILYGFFEWYEIYQRFDMAIKDDNSTLITMVSGQLAYALFDFDNSLNGTFKLTKSDRNMLTSASLEAGVVEYILDLSYYFLKGANVLQSEKVEYCQNNATTFRSNIDYAIDQFHNGTEEGLYNGVGAIADQFAIFHDLNSICIDGYESAVSAITAYMKVWNKPIEIIYNIVWGYRKVYKHMTAAIECGFNMDAQCTGENSGYLVYYIFSHNPK